MDSAHLIISVILAIIVSNVMASGYNNLIKTVEIIVKEKYGAL